MNPQGGQNQSESQFNTDLNAALLAAKKEKAKKDASPYGLDMSMPSVVDPKLAALEAKPATFEYKNEPTKDLLAQARTQITEEIKMLKEQKSTGNIADDAYALRVNTLYESAKQLYELKQRMEAEKQKTTHETSVQYINHKYDISKYTEVKKTQRELFDLVQDNRKMREKDVKELNKMTNEFRSVGNLNQIQVTELRKKMTELVARYK